MKSGQGRLILPDGKELTAGYRIASQEHGNRCQGTVIGDLRSVDPGLFAHQLKFVSGNDLNLSLLVMNYSDRHLTFIGEDQSDRRRDITPSAEPKAPAQAESRP